MYIAFCGLSLSGKKQYQHLSIEYMMQQKHVTLNNMLVISELESTDLGRAIVPLDREKVHINDTVRGLLYLAVSCNAYDNSISKAVTQKHHVFSKGCFAEVLGYQGSIFGDQGISWELLKSTYTKMLESTHSSETIKYPDIIFFCVSSFEQTQARAICNNIQEVGLIRDEFEKYTSKMREAYNVIAKDTEFCKHTKVLLLDDENTTFYDVWNSKVKPEINYLFNLQ